MPPVAATPTKKPTTSTTVASKKAASPSGTKPTTTATAASPKKKSTAKKAPVAAVPDLTKERYSMGIAPKHNLSFCGVPTAAKKATTTKSAAIVENEEAAEENGEVAAAPVPAAPVTASYATSSVVLRAIAEGYVPKGMEVYVETVKAQQARIAAEKAQPATAEAPPAVIEEESPLKRKGVTAPKKVHAAAPKKKASKKGGATSNFSTRSGALRVYGQLAHAFVDASKKVAKVDQEGGNNNNNSDEPVPSSEDATAALTHLGVAHLHCFGGTGEPSTKKKTKAAAAAAPAGPQPSFKKSYGYFFAAGSPKASSDNGAAPTAQTLLSRYYMATQQLRGQGTDKSIHAAQEAFNFVIANESVDKSLAAASLYQLGRLHETGKFVEVCPRDAAEDASSPAASPVKGSTSKTPVSSPRGPAARPTKPTSSTAKQAPGTAAAANQDSSRVAATVLKLAEDGTGAMAPTLVWITTMPASEASAIDMYKQAAARGSEDAQRRVEMIVDAQTARKRKENELAIRKAQRQEALAAAASALYS